MTSPTSPTISTVATGSPVTDARFVEAAELICPGCGEQVRCVPPVIERGNASDDAAAETATAVMGEFSHRDGSPLCCGVGGHAAEPVELVRAVR